MTVIVLFKIKSNGVQTDNFCKAFMKLHCHSYIFIVSKQSKYLLWSHKLATKTLFITSGENNCTKQRNQQAKWPQTLLFWKINVFLFKPPYYFKIHRTILEILWKKMITIISEMLKIDTWEWQGSQQSFINALHNLITSWIIIMKGANCCKNHPSNI